MFLRALILLAALAAASPAWAWNNCGAFDAASAGTGVGAVTGIGKVGTSAACHDTSGTTDSLLLTVDAQFVSVELDPNMAAIDSGASGCEVQVYRCRSTTATTSDLTSCTKELTDTDGDGILNDVTLDGVTTARRGIQAIQAKYLLIDVTANGSSHNCRTMVSGY